MKDKILRGLLVDCGLCASRLQKRLPEKLRVNARLDFGDFVLERHKRRQGIVGRASAVGGNHLLERDLRNLLRRPLDLYAFPLVADYDPKAQFSVCAIIDDVVHRIAHGVNIARPPWTPCEHAAIAE